DSYLTLLDDLRTRFTEEQYPVHSFPELSLASWHYKEAPSGSTSPVATGVADDGSGKSGDTTVQPACPVEPYSVAHLLEDGCFLERMKVEQLLERLRAKKNLILQGPPGTGKTWLAKRLAFALIGEKDDSRVRAA